MNTFVLNMEHITLDQHDIMEIAKPEKTTYMEYSEVIHKGNLKEVLGGYDGVFIFLKISGESVGHWVCVFKGDGGKIHYFDPYGKTPGRDVEMSGQDHKEKFTQLMSDAIVNKFAYQKMTNSINTCGRWCALRIRLRCLNPIDFHKFIKSSGKVPDVFVSYVTGLIAPKQSCHQLFKRTGVRGELNRS